MVIVYRIVPIAGSDQVTVQAINPAGIFKSHRPYFLAIDQLAELCFELNVHRPPSLPLNPNGRTPFGVWPIDNASLQLHF
jgi:hypothetical protein